MPCSIATNATWSYFSFPPIVSRILPPGTDRAGNDRTVDPVVVPMSTVCTVDPSCELSVITTIRYV